MNLFNNDLAAVSDVDRRQFLKGVGTAGASMFAAGLLAGCGGSGSSNSGPSSSTDAEVLNFALNLEYLEAEFYAYATTGQGLNPSLFTGVGTQGATTGGSQVTLDAATMAIAKEIANDEMEHVVYLREALGSAAVAKPAINLAALGIGFASQAQFLTLARAFEDVGVSAYGGAATLISKPANLQAAAQILAVEAYHAGNIRLLIAQQNIPTTMVDSNDVLPPPSGTDYFTTGPNALAIIRTTQAVLSIVYAGGTSSGGFFPAGFNGSIKASLLHK